MITINWPIVITTTIILYVLIILSLPFSIIMATVMLFSLIGFWSQLPGVCVMEPVRILYMMDFIDIFTVIIAMHVGIIEAVVFTLIWNTFPYLAGGGFLPFIAMGKDAVTQAILALFIPLFSALTGGNIVLIVLIYSVLRIPLFFIISLVIPHRSIPEQIVQSLAAGTSMMLINVFYANLFGGFFESLLLEGASFSWILFLVATIIVFGFAIIFMGWSPKKTARKVGKTAIAVAKKKKVKHKSYDHDYENMRKIKEEI